MRLTELQDGTGKGPPCPAGRVSSAPRGLMPVRGRPRKIERRFHPRSTRRGTKILFSSRFGFFADSSPATTGRRSSRGCVDGRDGRPPVRRPGRAGRRAQPGGAQASRLRLQLGGSPRGLGDGRDGRPPPTRDPPCSVQNRIVQGSALHRAASRHASASSSRRSMKSAKTSMFSSKRR